MRKISKIKVDFETKTNGRGYWSRSSKVVPIFKIEMAYLSVNKNDKFGELRAYFKSKHWSVEEHGLIYTDDLWLSTFKDALGGLGFSQKALDALDYSEQGLQGDNYVSLDVHDRFIEEYALIKTFGNPSNYR